MTKSGGIDYLVDIDKLLRQQKQLVSDLHWEGQDATAAESLLRELEHDRSKGLKYYPLF